jgi:Dolichyl-phosphate-mannose-protein mannosyltransferase
MEQTIARRKLANGGAGIVAMALRAPQRVLAVLLALHLIVWTALPVLVCPNLQLDLAEGLALGREWQLGYWKHPPLPWWIDEISYRVTGQIDSVYVLGPLAAIACLYGVWLLAREVTDEITALIAVVALEGVHFYNFSAVKFAQDQVQLPFWAFAALFFHRALRNGRNTDWVLSGVLLAGAFWSKYAAFVLASTLGLFLLLDPWARRAWRRAGPYLMAIVFLAVLAPNLWWLWNNDFLPFRYVDERAAEAVRWYQYFTFPATWTVDNLLALSPAIALLVILIGPNLQWRGLFRHPEVRACRQDGPQANRVSKGTACEPRRMTAETMPPAATDAPSSFETRPADPSRLPRIKSGVAPQEVGLGPYGGGETVFDRRYVTALALGPFLVTTVIAAALGRQPVAMWAYPLWSFAPLAALMWFQRAADFDRLRLFAIAATAVFLAFPIGYAASELFEPFVHDRPKATEFPGRLLADAITQEWRETTGMPLAYVGGAEFGPSGAGEFAPDLVAVYSPDHPRVIVHGDPHLSPWIDLADVERRGAVLIWEWTFSRDLPETLKSTFPHAELQPPLLLPRQTLYPRTPRAVRYAFVRPRP